MSNGENTFENDEVIDFYRSHLDLFPPEQFVFGEYVQTGWRILDLGVGAGRTIAALSAEAAEYVASDISQGMVDACLKAHPACDVRWGDATDLTEFADGSFDLVVFSFNGIDCLDDAGRTKCINEVRRVLTDDGRFILSRHNARSLVQSSKALRCVRLKIAAARVHASVTGTVRLAWRRLRSAAFWRGQGRELDPVHGGMVMRTTTPKLALGELSAVGFHLVAGPIPFEYPKTYRWWRTPWFYLVLDATS